MVGWLAGWLVCLLACSVSLGGLTVLSLNYFNIAGLAKTSCVVAGAILGLCSFLSLLFTCLLGRTNGDSKRSAAAQVNHSGAESGRLMFLYTHVVKT